MPLKTVIFGASVLCGGYIRPQTCVMAQLFPSGRADRLPRTGEGNTSQVRRHAMYPGWALFLLPQACSWPYLLSVAQPCQSDTPWEQAQQNARSGGPKKSRQHAFSLESASLVQWTAPASRK